MPVSSGQPSCPKLEHRMFSSSEIHRCFLSFSSACFLDVVFEYRLSPWIMALSRMLPTDPVSLRIPPSPKHGLLPDHGLHPVLFSSSWILDLILDHRIHIGSWTLSRITLPFPELYSGRWSFPRITPGSWLPSPNLDHVLSSGNYAGKSTAVYLLPGNLPRCSPECFLTLWTFCWMLSRVLHRMLAPILSDSLSILLAMFQIICGRGAYLGYARIPSFLVLDHGLPYSLMMPVYYIAGMSRGPLWPVFLAVLWAHAVYAASSREVETLFPRGAFALPGLHPARTFLEPDLSVSLSEPWRRHSAPDSVDFEHAALGEFYRRPFPLGCSW